MKTLTTSTLLRLEEAGGVISGGSIPQGITPDSSLQDWVNLMPQVSGDLLGRWYNYYHAKRELDITLKHYYQGELNELPNNSLSDSHLHSRLLAPMG